MNTAITSLPHEFNCLPPVLAGSGEGSRGNKLCSLSQNITILKMHRSGHNATKAKYVQGLFAID